MFLAVLICVAVHVCICMYVLQKCVCMDVPTGNRLISLPDWKWKHRAAAALPQSDHRIGQTLAILEPLSALPETEKGISTIKK